MNADVTIFLPVYNGANYIKEAIDSVLAQSYSNWTFLIVDNCSTDNTAEICKPYLTDSRFQYILNETNLGMYGNFHKALNLCKTPYFTYISHDDLFIDPQAIAHARELLEADTELAMVNTPLRWVDEYSTFIPSLGMASTEKMGKINAQKLATRCILECRNLYGVAVLARTNLGQQLKLDERLHQAADVNFFIGLGNVGLEKHVYVLQKPAYAVRFHQTNNTLHEYATLVDEMKIIANNHLIKLTSSDKAIQLLNSYKVRLGKWVFFKLLHVFAKFKQA